MQASTQPQAATAPTQTPASPVSITTVGPGGTTQTLTIPRTEAEVGALLAQREALSEQLTSVTSRRRGLSEEIRSAPDGASRTGLEERIRLLDQRILQLETDLGAAGRQLSLAPAELIASTESQRVVSDSDFEEGLLIGGFSVFLLFPIALFLARRRWKRRVAASPVQQRAESAQRLERLEQGMEAIAIEIERVAEGQRFVTRLLSESPAPLGASHRIARPAAFEHEDPAKR